MASDWPAPAPALFPAPSPDGAPRLHETLLHKRVFHLREMPIYDTDVHFTYAKHKFTVKAPPQHRLHEEALEYGPFWREVLEPTSAKSSLPGLHVERSWNTLCPEVASQCSRWEGLGSLLAHMCPPSGSLWRGLGTHFRPNVTSKGSLQRGLGTYLVHMWP